MSDKLFELTKLYAAGYGHAETALMILRDRLHLALIESDASRREAYLRSALTFTESSLAHLDETVGQKTKADKREAA